MADEEFRILVDLGHLALPNAITADEFPHLSYAVELLANQVEAQWKGFAAGQPMPNGQVIQTRTGEYVRSIMQRVDGALSRTIYTDLPYADAIEHGSPARDLKTMLNSSLKVRVSKDGRRYLIIPFRHNAPGSVLGNSMPEAVAQWWQGKAASHITGHGWRASGTGAVATADRTTGGLRLQRGQPVEVRKRTYSWGTRLGKRDLDQLQVGPDAQGRMAGMVNFRRPGKTGGAAHSSFITFRVMAEGAPGWTVKAQDGKYPARTTAEIYRPVAEDIFARAMEEDVRLFLGGEPP